MGAAEVYYPTYGSLGVRPLINCMGTYTIISGSTMLPEVRLAMQAAAQQYVHIDELMEAAGRRIAQVMQCEWGLVTNGCAAALCQVTAACVAGTDPEKMIRLPDTRGMRDEVVVQACHRHTYDHAVRTVGVRLVEVETLAELEAAMGERTAMLLAFGDAALRGRVALAQMAAVGHRHGVPLMVDAAAERPDVPNWYLEQGADAVAYSGGKCLRGPQAAGLVLGRKELLQAAFLNGAPHHALGRPMKIGKEEIMGMVAAVEMWVRRDHRAEWATWERRLDVISQCVCAYPSVTTRLEQPGRSNVAPVLVIAWDQAALPLSGTDVKRQLAAGEPRIEVFARADGFSVMPYMMADGDEQHVVRRLHEILGAATQGAAA